MEDLFEQSVQDVKLNGKSFSRLDKFDEALFYGKMVFADQVIRANIGAVNFDGFRELLDRIKPNFPTRRKI